MSAIAGILRTDELVNAAQLQSLLASMRNRGADAQRCWHEGNVGLCHAMMHTTPESLTEILPAQSSDKAVAITADARLDNRADLFSKLEIERHARASISDSELILHAFRRWGENCLQHLLGDFVFAIWDKNQRSLFVAMDPMGTRRLHYFYSDNKFVFATDIKTLLASQCVKKEFDEEIFLMQASALTRLTLDRTCFKGVNRLTGGKYLRINVAESRATGIQASLHDYYQFQPSQLSFGRPEDCLEAFRDIFQKAVFCRMRSAFPVATLLSGGLDSSSVTCVGAGYARTSGQSLHAISSCLADGEPGEDESEFINLVAQQEAVSVTRVAPTAGPLQLLDTLHDMTASPLSTNPHLYSALYVAARDQGARTLLDGLGGEWGPTNHGHGYFARRFRKLQLVKLFSEISIHAKIYSRSRYSILRNEIARPLVPSALVALYSGMAGREPGYLKFALIEEMTKKYNVPDLESVISKRELHFGDMQKTRLKVIDTGRKYKDGFADYFGIRCAYPFFDTRVLEFCLGLGPEWFVKDGWKRYLMRAAMEGILPKKVQWRTDKKPFSPNYYRLLQADSKRYQAVLNEIPAGDFVRNYVDVERIKRTIRCLDQRGTWAPVNGADHARMVVDYGVQSIFFLRWFQRA